MKKNNKMPFLKMNKAIFLETWGVVLMAAMTAILIVMAACKGTPTTPTSLTTPTTVEDTFGTVVGSLNGVVAYSNRTMEYRSNQDNFYNGVNTGKKWLCSEYVRRYYYQIYGYYINTSNYDGTATSFYELAKSLGGLLAYPNGGSVAPQVGDIICGFLQTGFMSHVAIVREVGPNYINVIQQNWNNTPLDNNQTLSRDGNRVDPFNSNYPILGWNRMPSVNLK